MVVLLVVVRGYFNFRSLDFAREDERMRPELEP
jgi:hypothetical protein